MSDERTEAGKPLFEGVVAVVDDDQGIEQALQAWLSMMQIPVRTFSNGPALLAALAPVASGWVFREGGGSASTQAPSMAGPAQPAGQQKLGALVIDLNLPGPNGFEVARQLHAHTPRLPVVVITPVDLTSMPLHGGIPPGVVCLSKPFDLDVLEAVLFSR